MNFVDGATAQWNGSDRVTQFVDSAHVKATITGSDLFSIGAADVTVTNPTPGGGTSNTLSFVIAKLYQLFLPNVRR